MLNQSRLLMAVILFSALAPQARANDADDIKSSLRDLSVAMQKGDAPTAKSLTIPSEGGDALIDATSRLSEAGKQLQEAATAAFGEEGQKIRAHRTDPAHPKWLESLEQSKIDVNGDTAQVSTPGLEKPLQMKRAGGKWKADLANTAAFADTSKEVEFIDKISRVWTEASADIKAGKYKTVQEARRAMGRKMLGELTPASQPATDR